MIADQINHAREVNPKVRRFPFSSPMESLASQARPAAVLWLAGFFQAARLHRVVSFCARSSASVHTFFSLDFVLILFDFWWAKLTSSQPARSFDYLFVSMTLSISCRMQLEGTIHQDCTVLPAERAYLPWEVPSFVIDFDPRLNFVFFLLLWCVVDLELLEHVSRVSQFFALKCCS